MAKSSNQKTEQHRCFCTGCGNEGIPITRRVARKKEQAHLKKLYCLTCNTEVNHVEISQNGIYEVSDFERDFEAGKFNT